MDSQILKRMKEVEKAVLQLDESVRGAAFGVMRDYILGGSGGESSGGPQKRGGRRKQTETTETKPTPEVVAPAGFQGFIDKFESDNKPDQNAKAIAAHLYREYGVEPFSLEEVRDLATKGGVTIPARIDMTFLAAKHGKKKLFKRAGKGKFRPTVHGEGYFKDTYGVKKGTKKRPETEA